MPRTARAFLLAAIALLAGAGPSADAEFDRAALTIRCDCGCHPQSVKECACGRAAEMRDEIRELLAGGLTGDEVIARYVEAQGEQIRLSPTATGFNLVAWLGPALGLLLATGVMLAVLRRWKRTPHLAAAAGGGLADPPGDDAYRERLRQALERLE